MAACPRPRLHDPGSRASGYKRVIRKLSVDSDTGKEVLIYLYGCGAVRLSVRPDPSGGGQMASLLRFSEAAALALHAMARVAAGRGDVVSARTLANDCRASEAHMIKVCRRLAQGGLLTPHRGAGGGFTLGRSAGKIRLFDVYTLIEGPVVLKPCLFQNHDCAGGHDKKCVFGRMILGFEKDVLRYLKQTTVSSVAAQCACGKAR
jgi:Rrf2 family protein